MKDQRRVSNLFVKSNLIAKYGKLVLIAWGLTLAISLTGNWYLHNTLTHTVLPSIQPELQAQVQSSLDQFLIRSLSVNMFAFTALIWSILAFLTLMNHRIYGPIDVLKDFIGHLKSGNFDPPKRSLRETDELKPLMEELNGLADALKK
jgi:hypothetical protein